MHFISLPYFSNVSGMFPPQSGGTLTLFLSWLFWLQLPAVLTITSFRSTIKCHLHSKVIHGQLIQKYNHTITNSALSPSLFPFYILFFFVLLPSNIQYIFISLSWLLFVFTLFCQLPMGARIFFLEDSCAHHYTTNAGIFFLTNSLLYLHYLEHCRVGSRCSINIYQMNT